MGIADTRAVLVSAAPKARAEIAHLGPTGYELDTTKLSSEEILEMKNQIDEYKSMRDLVLKGDFYRLNNPYEENLFAVELVDKEKNNAYITVMRPLIIANMGQIIIKPKGLDENKLYFVEKLGLTLRGSTLMNVGLHIRLPDGDFITETYKITVKEK